MLRKNFVLITMAASLIAGAVSARAQDAGALLDLLVRKHLITDQEAEEVRGELTSEAAATAAGKLKLSTPITEIELYGDARLRYEVRTAQSGQRTRLPHPEKTLSEIASATACALVSAVLSRMTGSLACAWKRVPTRARPMSRLAMRRPVDRSPREVMESMSARPTSVIKDSTISP